MREGNLKNILINNDESFVDNISKNQTTTPMTEAFVIDRICNISQKLGKEKGKTNNEELKTIARWQLSIPSLLFK